MKIEELLALKNALSQKQEEINGDHNGYEALEAETIREYCKKEKLLSELDWNIIADRTYIRLRTRNGPDAYKNSRLYKEILIPFRLGNVPWFDMDAIVSAADRGSHFEFYIGKLNNPNIILNIIKDYNLKVYADNQFGQHVESERERLKNLEELYYFCKIV